MFNYNWLKDKHLNVFCGFNYEHLENNVTKAFINTLDSLNIINQIKVMETLLELNITNENLSFSLYLQKNVQNK